MDAMDPPAQIRRLLAGDAEAFSALRREVTADDPVPMGLTLEEERTRPIEGFRAQLAAAPPNAVFGAFVQGELAATAAVSLPAGFGSARHKMLMWGVFTSPRHRRRGLARTLVRTALDHAFGAGARRVNLLVYVPNAPALRLYRTLGFVEYGIEPEAVRLHGTYYDGVHMSLYHDA